MTKKKPKTAKVVPWKQWFMVEYKVAGGDGHLLFRIRENAELFAELVEEGNREAAWTVALGRLSRLPLRDPRRKEDA